MYKSDEIELYYADAGSLVERQSHVKPNQNAFLLCTEGSVTLAMDGKKYTLRRGDAYIYPAFSQTTVQAVSTDMRGVGGVANFQHVLKAMECVSAPDRLAQIRLQPRLELTDEQFERVCGLVDSISRRRRQPSLFIDSIVLGMVQVLLFELMDAYAGQVSEASVEGSRSDTVFVRFLSALAQHFRSEREVNFYASELRLTPRYFASIVRARSGLSPGAWIARFVVSEAKTLLSQPDASIKEVASRLNFPNQSFFGRYFKQHTGLTPGEYRRQATRTQFSSL